ncbi:MAG: tetratricopeptide repeat protein [Hydrotalea sp.]|nr:tetratricopeptide repeat protein [Hydrotalea sp.]
MCGDWVISAAVTTGHSQAEEAARANINQALMEKNNEKGLMLLEQAIAQFPNHLWFQYRLSVLFYELGRRREALATLEKVCEREPNNPDYAMALGTYYYDNPERDFQKAIKYMNRALELKPFEQQAWRNYGVILYKYGEVKKGLEALYRAVQLAPDDFVTTNALCMYLTEQGRRDEGRTFGAIGLLGKHQNALNEFQNVKLPAALKKLQAKPTMKSGMKNVFSFSLWGGDETYSRGMMENALMMPRFFPGWVVRCYHDESVPAEAIEKIKQAGAETILMTGKHRDLNPGMWRFLVANDPAVYYFCCRDADCRPFVREQAAVEAWIKSGKSFHIMRDDIWHNEVMLAGLWGGIAGMLPVMEQLINATFQKSTNRWHDQVLLKNYIWPMIYQDSLQHDGNYSLFGAMNYPIPRVMGDSMHVGYGHKITQNNDRVYNATKNENESFDAMLHRLWHENLNRNPDLQEIEVADQLGNKVVLRRLANSAAYQTIRPSLQMPTTA